MKKLLYVFSLVLTISAQAQESRDITYIRKHAILAVEEMQLYKVPASITLAQGLLETGGGQSKLADQANNHFGIKCHKDWKGATIFADDDLKNECFRKYPSVKDSYDDHSLFLKTKNRYAFLFDLQSNDYKGWAYGLKKAGYATNSQYAIVLIKMIEDYNLNAYDKAIYIPVAQLKNHKIEKIKSTQSQESDFDDITIGVVRNVYYRNKVPYIIAVKGDNLDKIAEDFALERFQLEKYNDLQKNAKIKEGELIYVKKKKRKTNIDFHIVEENESIRDVSQRFAVRIKKILTYNDLEENYTIKQGDTLWLHKK